MHYEFTYSSGRPSRVFDDLDAFIAALPRRRTADAVIWAYTRWGSSTGQCVETADEARRAAARISETLAKIAADARRPKVWAEHAPERLADHMATRPHGHCRADWAEKLTDPGLDDQTTVDEEVARIKRDDPQRMLEHRSSRPAGCNRPDWDRRIVLPPVGGYDAYKRLVMDSGRRQGRTSY